MEIYKVCNIYIKIYENCNKKPILISYFLSKSHAKTALSIYKEMTSSLEYQFYIDFHESGSL